MRKHRRYKFLATASISLLSVASVPVNNVYRLRGGAEKKSCVSVEGGRSYTACRGRRIRASQRASVSCLAAVRYHLYQHLYIHDLSPALQSSAPRAVHCGPEGKCFSNLYSAVRYCRVLGPIFRFGRTIDECYMRDPAQPNQINK